MAALSAINGGFNGERTWGSGGGEKTAVFSAGSGAARAVLAAAAKERR
jgi:hypothetical protein